MNPHQGFARKVEHVLLSTRGVLERAPEASMDWAPHPRSFSLGGLTTHLARLPHWGAQMMARDDHDLDSGGGRRDSLTEKAAVLDLFDRHAAELQTSLRAATPEWMEATWTLRRGAAVLVAMPRIEALDHFLVHHLIHHRGQLTVYLRLLNVPLPPLYGPTADERP